MTKFRRPIEEILEEFKKPIPSELLKVKPTYSKGRKSGEVQYVPWYVLISLLEEITPAFDWEIRSQHFGDRTVVEGRLTIRAAEGDFVREATGQEESDCDGFGDPTSNAEAMALRRCCAKFGLGLALWGGSSSSIQPGTVTRQKIVRQKLLDRLQDYFAGDSQHVKDQTATLFGRVIPRREMTDAQLLQLVLLLDKQAGVVEEKQFPHTIH
jgi:hypothetical protein